jgi:hypothetical protein
MAGSNAPGIRGFGKCRSRMSILRIGIRHSALSSNGQAAFVRFESGPVCSLIISWQVPPNMQLTRR